MFANLIQNITNQFYIKFIFGLRAAGTVQILIKIMFPKNWVGLPYKQRAFIIYDNDVTLKICLSASSAFKVTVRVMSDDVPPAPRRASVAAREIHCMSTVSQGQDLARVMVKIRVEVRFKIQKY